MNIRDLKYFLAVAKLRHFGNAAEQCHVSQPTLSGQIKKLEQTLGVTLFERTNRRVMLTECGQQVAASAERVLAEIETIHELVQAHKDPFSGSFKLGAFPTLSTYIFPRIVEVIKQNMPDLHLTLVEEKTADLLEKLRVGVIDAALMALPVGDTLLESHILFEDAFYLAVPSGHPLARETFVDQDLLRGHRVLLLEEGHCLRDQALEVCGVTGLAQDLDMKATGLETLRQMVRAGVGMTFIPEIALKREDPGIVYVPFAPPVPNRTIGLVWRKTSTRTKVISSLCDYL